MGLRSETFLEFETLGMGMTVASFQSEGTVPVVMLKLHKKVNCFIRIIMACLTILALRFGMPLDLYVFMALISSSSSCSEIKSKSNSGVGGEG